MGNWSYDGGLGLAQLASGVERLDSAEAMRLLASVVYGRVVFTLDALPAIRPVNHLVDDGQVIIRTHLTSAVAAAAQSTVLVYEADNIDPRSRSGWSVVVAGRGRALTDPDQISRYEQLLHPWVNHAGTVVAITPEIIAGLRITATEA